MTIYQRLFVFLFYALVIAGMAALFWLGTSGGGLE